MAVDFEKEGLLAGVEGDEARNARLELLERLSDDGVHLDELRQATEEGRLALLPVERLLSGDGPCYTQEQIAEKAGLDPELFVRIWRALGMPMPDEEQEAFSEADLKAAQNSKRFLDAGIHEQEFLELTRSMSQAVAGVAAAVGAAFAEALLKPGDSESEIALRLADGTRELTPLLDQTLNHMLHLHLRQRSRSAVIGQAELASGQMPGAQEMGFCFADLVGFTKLGERVPSEELGSVASRLAEMAANVAEPPVRMVKTIGDAAMLVSEDPDCLLKAALDLADAAEQEGESFPSIHAGLAHGEALPRGGDWYGHPVNLASRIADFSLPGSVVVTKELREAAQEDYSWSRIGPKKLKGIRDETELFRVRPPSSDGDDGV